MYGMVEGYDIMKQDVKSKLLKIFKQIMICDKRSYTQSDDV